MGSKNRGQAGSVWQFVLGAAIGALFACVVLLIFLTNAGGGTSNGGLPLKTGGNERTVRTMAASRPVVIEDRVPGLPVDEEEGPRMQNHQYNAGQEAHFQPQQRQLFGDRKFSVPTNGKSLIPQIKGTDDSTIFVAMAAYRDVECAETLLEMYREAHNPARLRIRIIQHISQTENGEMESCARFFDLADCGKGGVHPICMYSKHIVIKSLPRTQGMGPVDARHRVQALLDDEEFAMMIDAHTKFKPKWDKLLMDNWNELNDEMAIITTYPLGYVLRNEPFPKPDAHMTILCDSRFMEDLHIPRHQAGQYAPPGKSYLVPFWSACVSFSKAHAFRTVMFDCCAPYTFDGEEFSYGIRLWTHGYDFYSPKDTILMHQYYHPGVVQRTGRKRNLYHENKWNEHYKVMRESNERFRQMLGLPKMQEANMKDIEKYGMGNVRTRQQYIEFSGVKLDEGTQDFICDKIIKGEGLKLVPLNFEPTLPYTGTTVDPDPLLEKIRQIENEQN